MTEGQYNVEKKHTRPRRAKSDDFKEVPTEDLKLYLEAALGGRVPIPDEDPVTSPFGKRRA